eukprot:Anaeramoba_ignava/a352594_902.p1 GENE.a352594_902~~a352594_902.p1  ORF type:complete len:395 (-),score=113.36 a352594_902:236-1420(-)
MKPTIVLLPGDGIGDIVLKQAVRVLDAVGFKANYEEADIGWEFWKKEGNALPERTVKQLEKHKIGLFGAITSKPKKEADEELGTHLKGKGLVYYSPIVTLRQHFDLNISIRPCKTFAGNPLNFVRKTVDGKLEEPNIDIVVFRQNTEGLYSGVEWTNPPKVVRDAFETHPRFKNFKSVPGPDLAISTRIFTRRCCKKIAEDSFAYAHKFGYKNLTVCEKPNVVRETSGMLEHEVYEVAKRYPDIYTNSTNIDAQVMWLTKNPEDFGVIVSGNMFGDILSDGAAGLVGGLGFACSSNVGPEVAVFEPTHGSAPKYAEFKIPIVNPIAMILSACMMLDHLGEVDKSKKIRDAISKVIKEGKYRTYDMLKMKGRPDVVERGAVSTEQLTTAIIKALI